MYFSSYFPNGLHALTGTDFTLNILPDTSLPFIPALTETRSRLSHDSLSLGLRLLLILNWELFMCEVNT